MSNLKDTTNWAISQGVRLNGVAAHRFSGRGVGIISRRVARPGDILMTIPNTAIRSFENLPKILLDQAGLSSVNGLLATELALDVSNAHRSLTAFLPTQTEFEEAMPFFWPVEMQKLLPTTSFNILEKQSKKLARDWKAISAAFPDLSYSNYVYNWFLVSTRTFYYTSSTPGVVNPPDPDDCLALLPFADYFNHADIGCNVTYSPSEYIFLANRRYEKGEEIFISYGNHSNDFLLVEYGFTLDENKWDEASLDEIMLPLFTREQRQILDEADFLGNYVADHDTVCYRTRMALSLLCMPQKTWKRLLASDLKDEVQYGKAVDEMCLNVLKDYLLIVNGKLQQLTLLEDRFPGPSVMIRRRWEQLSRLVLSVMETLEF